MYSCATRPPPISGVRMPRAVRGGPRTRSAVSARAKRREPSLAAYSVSSRATRRRMPRRAFPERMQAASSYPPCIFRLTPPRLRRATRAQFVYIVHRSFCRPLLPSSCTPLLPSPSTLSSAVPSSCEVTTVVLHPHSSQSSRYQGSTAGHLAGDGEAAAADPLCRCTTSPAPSPVSPTLGMEP
jgi:hypothetical protein